MKNRTVSARLLLYFSLTLIGFLVDLFTKNWIFSRLGHPGQRPEPEWVIDGLFGFQTSLNEGALFGLGQGCSLIFAALSVIVIGGIVLWIVVDQQKSFFLATVLGLICAGVLGNFWDRIGLHQMTWTSWDVVTGYCTPEMVGKPVYAVRDWILIMLGSYPWPNFNLADTFLVCGAILIGIYSIRQSRPAQPHAVTTAQTLPESTLPESSASKAPLASSEPTTKSSQEPNA